MLNWLKKTFGRSQEAQLKCKIDEFMKMADRLNATGADGEPETVSKRLGTLSIPSKTLVFGDPQYFPSLEIPNLPSGEISISADLWQFPSGEEMPIHLTIELGSDLAPNTTRKIGHVAIDSAKLVIADKTEAKNNWTDTGKDRIGLISTVRNDVLLRDLTRRFNLKTIQPDRLNAQIVGPVSETLQQQIITYLEGIPEYARFPFMHFLVRTNNSFDRVNFNSKPWDFIPVGNSETPLMFVCKTGRGDGRYNVNCTFSDQTPLSISISFMESD